MRSARSCPAISSQQVWGFDSSKFHAALEAPQVPKGGRGVASGDADWFDGWTGRPRSSRGHPIVDDRTAGETSISTKKAEWTLRNHCEGYVARKRAAGRYHLDLSSRGARRYGGGDFCT